MRQKGFGPGGFRSVWTASAGAAVALVLIAIAAAPALAAERFAAPTPAGAMNCSSPANACSIETAIGNASSGDEVIIEAGSYGTPTTPLASSIESGVPHVDVHGTDTAPGPPSARIYTTSTYGLSLWGAGSNLSDLEIVDSGAGNGGALLFEAEGGIAERVIARSGEHESFGCVLELTTILRDSVCQTESDAYAVEVSGTLDGPNHVTLRNVTAIAPNGDGISVESSSGSGRSAELTAINTIARGGAYDISAEEFTQPASITTSHSNYTTTHVLGGATIKDDGTSQITGDQSEAQLFVNPSAGNFSELPGAQTIDAGITEEANGRLDLEGNARAYPTYPCAAAGSNGPGRTDIGAYQYQPPAPPCPPPIHTTHANPPETTITKTKVSRNKTEVSFSFKAGSEAANGFECELISQHHRHHKRPQAAFSVCTSPKTYKHLDPGAYKFEVRAFNSVGIDPTPAIKRVTVKRHRG